MENTILIIQKDNIEFVHLMLELGNNYEFHSSANYSKCLSLTQEWNPDILILNVSSEEEEGYVDQVIKKVKTIDTFKNLCIIVIGFDNNKRLEEKYIEMGANDFISAPYKINIVKNKIETQFKIIDYIKQIEELSFYDKLTSLPNRRLFDIRAKDLLQLCLENKEFFSVLICDIDFFKKINDTYGHQTGDLVLQKVAEKIKSILREEDFISRWGGEEFVVLLKEANDIKTFKICEKIREAIKETKINIKDKNINVTISIGASCFIAKNNLNLDDYLKEADKALYESKNNGRNKTTLKLGL